MKTIKIIDLLNKIANEEELPNAIKFNDIFYKKADIGKDYYNFTINKLFFKDVFDASGVNLEVEIIEEEKKIPEKLGYQDNADGTFYLNHKKYNSEPIKILSKKINDIIDCLNYLKSKGE